MVSAVILDNDRTTISCNIPAQLKELKTAVKNMKNKKEEPLKKDKGQVWLSTNRSAPCALSRELIIFYLKNSPIVDNIKFNFNGNIIVPLPHYRQNIGKFSMEL